MTTSTETPVDTWNMSRSKMPVDVGSRKASPSIYLQTPQNPLTPQSTKPKKGRERERELLSPHLQVNKGPFKCKQKSIQFGKTSKSRNSFLLTILCCLCCLCTLLTRNWLGLPGESTLQKQMKLWGFSWIFLLGNRCLFQVSIKDWNMMCLTIVQCFLKLFHYWFQYV